MIVVLTGGTGGAKFVEGLKTLIPADELTIIVNTGDDLVWWGLHVSPDLDSITYALAGLLSKERGWGVDDDTFHCLQAMGRFGAPTWFQLGDCDLATHLARTNLLAAGKSLSGATAEIAAGLGVHSHILPMTNSKVETRIQTEDGELTFQEYFVRERYQVAVRGVRFMGAEHATPAPGVLEAITRADVIVLAPSNPVTSIGPILAVPAIRAALQHRKATVAAISPIVGNEAVSGPAGALMAAQGLPVSIAGIAEVYADFLDVLIVNKCDSDAASQLRKSGLRVHCAETVMRSSEDKIALARTSLELSARSSISGIVKVRTA